MRRTAVIFALALSTPAAADVDAALDRHILPGLAAFADAADDLARSAAGDCRAEAVRPAFHATFDAWMPVADLRIGPSETGALSIAFWPDPRGFTQRTLAGLVATQDAVAENVDGYAEVSIAARGLFALDMLIHDPAFADGGADSYACRLTATIAADLARQAAALRDAWTEGFAADLRTAGDAGNATFQTGQEATRAVYTQIIASLTFTADQRIGLPLSTYDRPRPAMAEARRSGRSLRNVVLAAEAAQGLTRALAGQDIAATDAALARVQAAAARIDDPAFQDVTDPQARLRVEVLQQEVQALRAAIVTEFGARHGITPGFNAQDGD